jgi:SAM-dependent methyltransferase
MERSEPTLRAVGNKNPELLPGSPHKLAGQLAGLDSEIVGSIGPSKNVLLVGCAEEPLAKVLDASQCDVVAVAFGDPGIEEAKGFCSSIIRSSLDVPSLPDSLVDSAFDAVVFHDALEHFREPWQILGDARRALRDGGFAVAVLPNITYGAARLALLQGSLNRRALGASDRLLGFTIDSANDLFVRAGYRVAQIERLHRPIFDPSGNLPQLDRAEFSPSLVAEIEAAPDADVVQFVVKGIPLSEEAKERSIALELQSANDGLTRANTTIERQKAEGRALRALVEQSRIRIEELENAFSDVSNAAVGEFVARDDLAKLRAELEHRASLISDLESAIATLTGDLNETRERAAQFERLLADSRTELKALHAAAAKPLSVAGEEAQRRIAELEGLLYQARTHSVTAAFLMQAELKTVRTQLAEAERRVHDSQAAAQGSIAQLERVAFDLRSELDAQRSTTAASDARDNDRVARITELEGMLLEFQAGSRAFEESARADIARLTDAAALTLADLDATRAQLADAERASADDRVARISELEEMLAELQAGAAGTLAELDSARAQLATAEQTAANDRSEAHAALEAARSAVAESEARHADSAVRDRDRVATITKLEGMLSELQASSRSFEERAREDIARLTESSVRALSELGIARAQLATSEQTAADDRAESRSVIDQLRRLTAESQAELDAARIGLTEHEARDTERMLRISVLEAIHADERSELERITAELDRTSAELEFVNGHVAELQSLKGRVAGRVSDLEDALLAERALSAQLGAVVEEARMRFDELEAATLLAIEESDANARRLEEAWFTVYQELESLQTETLRLEAAAQEKAAAATIAERALEMAEEELQRQRRERESAEAENTKVRETLAQTHSALRESRERAERFAAEVAVVKVRAIQAELSISDFERKIEEGAAYARHVESEIAATRKAALAERIVMRDYADEIRSLGEERSRTDAQRIAHLTERAERSSRELEQLRATNASDIQRLEAQIANVTAYGQEMRELLATAERRLLDQTEDTIADMQAESAQLVLLIDTVQSSHFWKLKRWLGRLLGRNRR